jgi:hypothetical protein
VALTEGNAFCTRRGEIGSTVGPGHLCFRGDYGLPLMNDERCTVYDVLRIVCQTRCAAGSRTRSAGADLKTDQTESNAPGTVAIRGMLDTPHWLINSSILRPEYEVPSVLPAVYDANHLFHTEDLLPTIDSVWCGVFPQRNREFAT